jgi:hypothetical protein
MKDSKNAFNILVSIEKHIEGLKPLVPKQAIVCIGEYPIKTLLREPTVSRDGTLPIFIEKSSDDIYKWIPKGYNPHLVVGFEDADIDTHFWYHVLPTIIRDKSVIDSLKKRSTEKLRGAIVFASAWDGVGSAALPSLISKFDRQNIDSLSIAVLPSQIQPADAHFNAYATLQLCLATEGSTVVLLGRDQLETFEGVDKSGVQIKGNSIVNYMLNIFLAKESLVQEISELSRTFNVKLFSAIAFTAASYRVYGSIENMLNTALLKPLSTFDLSSSKLLYVLLRMPANLKDKIPRAKIELAITDWFKEKTSPQSIHISEPIYTEDMSDRIDAVLFIGGFDTSKMFKEYETKVASIKRAAVERGLMTEDWRLPFEVEEEPNVIEAPATPEPTKTEELLIPDQAKPEELPIPEQPQTPEPTQPILTEPPQTVTVEMPQPVEVALTPAPEPVVALEEVVAVSTEAPLEVPSLTVEAPEPVETPKPTKPKRAPRTKKAKPKPEEKQAAQTEKPKRTRRNKTQKVE